MRRQKGNRLVAALKAIARPLYGSNSCLLRFRCVPALFVPHRAAPLTLNPLPCVQTWPQDELRLKTTKCDNCIIGTMIALQYIACICHIAACVTGSGEMAQLASLVDCIADIVWCT